MTLFELGSETIVIILLLIASIVGIAVRYIRVPYTVALVLVGLAVGVLRVLQSIQLTPHATLVVFLPALLSATDPVAVLTLFRQRGVPRRLQYVVIRGEPLQRRDGHRVVQHRCGHRRIGRISLHREGRAVSARVLRWGALETAWRHLERLHRDNVISDPVWRTLDHMYTVAGHRLNRELQTLLEQHPELQARELEQAQREALRAECSALNDLLRRGLISAEIYRQLIRDVDRRMADLQDKEAIQP